MALSRKDLEAIGIEPEKINAIIGWHMDTVKGLQAQINDAETKADKLTEVQAELDKVKKDLETANKTIEAASKDDYKGKYETATAELEKLRNDYANKEISAKKETTLKKAAKERKYSDESIAILLDSKADYCSKVEFDDKGNATNLDDLFKTIAADKPMLTPKIESAPASIPNPPANTGSKKAMSWEDIDKITDTAERQAAIAENMEALGIK